MRVGPAAVDHCMYGERCAVSELGTGENVGLQAERSARGAHELASVLIRVCINDVCLWSVLNAIGRNAPRPIPSDGLILNQTKTWVCAWAGESVPGIECLASTLTGPPTCRQVKIKVQMEGGEVLILLLRVAGRLVVDQRPRTRKRMYEVRK